MEELSGGGSRRPSRDADEREKKVAAVEIVGRTKKRENKYEKKEDICFAEKDICSGKNIFFGGVEKKGRRGFFRLLERETH